MYGLWVYNEISVHKMLKGYSQYELGINRSDVSTVDNTHQPQNDHNL